MSKYLICRFNSWWTATWNRFWFRPCAVCWMPIRLIWITFWKTTLPSKSSSSWRRKFKASLPCWFEKTQPRVSWVWQSLAINIMPYHMTLKGSLLKWGFPKNIGNRSAKNSSKNKNSREQLNPIQSIIYIILINLHLSYEVNLSKYLQAYICI